MSSERKNTLPNPTLDELRQELERVRKKKRKGRRSLIALTASAVVLVAVVIIAFALPVLRIHGSSMEPTLSPGDIIVAIRGDELSPGKMVAFEYGNKVLVKRVIACSGDLVQIQDDGHVLVNQQALREDYVSELVSGSPDIEQPYRVAVNEYFVLGDHRTESVDSRYAALGCVSKEQVIGRVMMRIWPLNAINIW